MIIIVKKKNGFIDYSMNPKTQMMKINFQS